MKKEDGRNITEEVLFRHFAEQLNDELNEEVLMWREANEDNHLAYESARIFYLDNKALANLGKVEMTYDKEGAWEKVKVKNRIGAPNNGKDTSFFLKLAASIVMIAGMSYVIYNQVFKVEEMELISLEEPIQKKLSDGSQITLNVNSKLKYPEVFKENKRAVLLTGEAYFEVEASKEKPFVIHVKDLEVTALGTAFNVKALAVSDSVLVSVDEGVVLMIYNGETQKLEAGDVGIFVLPSKVLETAVTKEIPTHNYWRTKQLAFNGNSLSKVVASIEEIYKVDIQLDNESIGNCKITVNFEDETVDDVLDVVAATLNLTVSRKEQKYILFGKGCDN